MKDTPLFKSLADSQLITCLKCGFRWLPRTLDPKECPECKGRRQAQPRGPIEIVKDGDYQLPYYHPARIEQREDEEEDQDWMNARIIQAMIFMQQGRG